MSSTPFCTALRGLFLSNKNTALAPRFAKAHAFEDLQLARYVRATIADLESSTSTVDGRELASAIRALAKTHAFQWEPKRPAVEDPAGGAIVLDESDPFDEGLEVSPVLPAILPRDVHPLIPHPMVAICTAVSVFPGNIRPAPQPLSRGHAAQLHLMADAFAVSVDFANPFASIPDLFRNASTGIMYAAGISGLDHTYDACLMAVFEETNPDDFATFSKFVRAWLLAIPRSLWDAVARSREVPEPSEDVCVQCAVAMLMHLQLNSQAPRPAVH